MVAQEIDRQRQQMIQQFTQQFGGANAQTFDKSMLPDELFKEQAEKSVKLGVLVSKVLADAKLEVDPARVETYIEDMASSYEDPTEVIEYFKMINSNVLKSRLLCLKTVLLTIFLLQLRFQIQK